MDGPWSYDDSKQQIIHKKLGKSLISTFLEDGENDFKRADAKKGGVVIFGNTEISGKCLALHADSSALVMRDCDDHNSYHK